MNIWGIHMGEHVGSAPIEDGYVGIGWSELGDLTTLGKSRETLKEALTGSFPEAKKATIAGNAGVLFRFVNEMQIGDIVVYPSKSDRMVNIGRVTGNYHYKADDSHGYPNHHEVEWLCSHPRNEFRQVALNEIGAFITLFLIRRNRDDFLQKIGQADSPENSDDDTNDLIDDETATESIAQKAEETTHDFLIKQLVNKLSPYEFEHFIAHLMECMGYTARVTPKSRDGGIDVIAHNDKLGFEPPIIKIQCKQITDQSSEPDANQLLGTLGEGEFGLFVNLGSYSQPARVLERNKAKLRLIDGEQLIALVLEHYSKLSPKYRTLLPLKQIYVPDLV